MESMHQVYFQDSCNMDALENESIDLVITSPPYPMIEMWDDSFRAADPAIDKALRKQDGNRAFDLMHAVLDMTWRELKRVLKTGGIACVNIGDATRTINGTFQLYPNHTVIVSAFRKLGFSNLPNIIWRKPTNAPTKFMGSGMLPPGAYVTLEHEYILVFRKGDKREFSDDKDKQTRRESAYFWEERNDWFSDVWFDLIGAQQAVKSASQRTRSGAFPFELPYRLLNMFSIAGDTVLDPFAGTGTTMQAAMCSRRHSICYEKDPGLQSVILEKIASVPDLSRDLVQRRLEAHARFIEERSQIRGAKGTLKYNNKTYGFPVMTRQEEELKLDRVLQVRFLSSEKFAVNYSQDLTAVESSAPKPVTAIAQRPEPLKGRQLKIF